MEVKWEWPFLPRSCWLLKNIQIRFYFRNKMHTYLCINCMHMQRPLVSKLFVLTPGVVCAGPVYGKPQFSWVQMVYFHIFFKFQWFTKVSRNFKLTLLHGLIKFLGFTALSRNFIMTLVWIVRQNFSISRFQIEIVFDGL